MTIDCRKSEGERHEAGDDDTQEGRHRSRLPLDATNTASA